jgi:hypothetical protein
MFFPQRACGVRLHHLPDTIAAHAVPLTGFRQYERISVTPSSYRHAPWVKNGQSRELPEGHSTS